MSDLANFVAAVIRDKVVEDIKVENEKLVTKNSIMSKAILLEPPSFVRVEIGPQSRSLVAHSLQYPDPQAKCDCCSWYPFTMERTLPIIELADVDLFLGSIPELPLSKSTKFKVHQVTGYATDTQTTAMQINDLASGGTLHVAIGPIPRLKAKKLFSKTPRDLRTFCERFHAVAPNAMVEIVCYSIPNRKAIPFLVKGGLTENEARKYLKIPSKEEEEEEKTKSSAKALTADGAKVV